jgi:hypothetical protein
MPGMRLGVAILVWSVTVAGATLEKLSVEEMAAKSTAIVRAKAVSSAAGYVGSTIYTRTRFQVMERWKGPEATEVVVSEPGGTVDGVSQKYGGVPRFTPGQEVILFLWTGPSGRTQVIGLSQGVLQVQKSAAGEEEVVREPSGETMLSPGTWEPVREDGIRMPLRHLVLQVRGFLERGRGVR